VLAPVRKFARKTYRVVGTLATMVTADLIREVCAVGETPVEPLRVGARKIPIQIVETFAAIEGTEGIQERVR
jgi:hypothetical protein